MQGSVQCVLQNTVRTTILIENNTIILASFTENNRQNPTNGQPFLRTTEIFYKLAGDTISLCRRITISVTFNRFPFSQHRNSGLRLPRPRNYINIPSRTWIYVSALWWPHMRPWIHINMAQLERKWLYTILCTQQTCVDSLITCKN